MRLAIATGTRADWGLLQPLASRLQDEGDEVLVVATHQHLISDMGNTIAEILADGFTPAARIPATGDAASIMALAAPGFARELPRLRPDALIILGDRCEMLGAASAALLTGVPIVHIAGGTISEGAFDDSVRHAITKMASLHLPETRLCASRILQMGEEAENVVVTGALGVYNTLHAPRMSREELAESLDGWDPGEHLLLGTLHAATLGKASPLELQEEFLAALRQLPEQYRILLTYPNSDTDPSPLIASLHEFERSMGGRVKVIPSLGRIRYISAAAMACGVVGNSSSALVEVPSLGTPSLDIGIRQQGREHGESVIHSGVRHEEILSGLQRLLAPEMQELAARCPNPYAADDTPGKMVRAIRNHKFSPYPQKHFCRLEADSLNKV